MSGLRKQAPGHRLTMHMTMHAFGHLGYPARVVCECGWRSGPITGDDGDDQIAVATAAHTIAVRVDVAIPTEHVADRKHCLNAATGCAIAPWGGVRACQCGCNTCSNHAPIAPRDEALLVICESVAAVTLHLREVTTDSPIRLGGHHPRPLALCGSEVAWDTQIPVTSVRCRGCIAARDASAKAVTS